MPRQIRVQSDGTGASTTVTLEDGTVIAANEAALFLGGGEINRVELVFLGPSLDVHAELRETSMICPICKHRQTHYCPDAGTL